MYQKIDLKHRKSAAVLRYDEASGQAPVVVARATGQAADPISTSGPRFHRNSMTSWQNSSY